MLFSIVFTGFTQRRRPFSPRNLRNFMIQNAAALIACPLVILGFGTLARSGPIGASEWAAGVTGATLVVIACLGAFATASVRAGVDLVDDEMAADDLRERGRLMLCSLAWIAACGLLLIPLGLAGPGGVLAPATALAGALALIAILTMLLFAASFIVLGRRKLLMR